MKLIKFLLVLSTFLIMVAIVFNLLYSTGESGDKTGIYIEVVVMFVLTLTMVLVNNLEKKIKDSEQNR
ncbi:hypothetical protein [Ancylomarina sp. 16SWW S1-10-2]|uniref:hypothetical protein n=1 Tax=Ancylomarina sp. 16SWW S1-10-2 TaxID=2499681 RepID=UPI0012AE9FC1|nr:hypothetical protein [Ancylomarina sp. 16SWW S1-10-2]MRT94750.1 hypothetical protein [Ancylomarina sp. 16SWW S1-10-2]